MYTCPITEFHPAFAAPTNGQRISALHSSVPTRTRTLKDISKSNRKIVQISMKTFLHRISQIKRKNITRPHGCFILIIYLQNLGLIRGGFQQQKARWFSKIIKQREPSKLFIFLLVKKAIKMPPQRTEEKWNLSQI